MTSAWFHQPPALGTRRQRLQSYHGSSSPPVMTTTVTTESNTGTSDTSSTSSSSTTATNAATLIHDSSLTPSPFQGHGQEIAQDWLNYFKRHVSLKQLSEPASLALFALLMRGTRTFGSLPCPMLIVTITARSWNVLRHSMHPQLSVFGDALPIYGAAINAPERQ